MHTMGVCLCCGQPDYFVFIGRDDIKKIETLKSNILGLSHSLTSYLSEVLNCSCFVFNCSGPLVLEIAFCLEM